MNRQAYWETCKPEKAKGKGKGKTKAVAEPEPKAKAKAKAKVKAKAKPKDCDNHNKTYIRKKNTKNIKCTLKHMQIYSMYII